MIIIGIVLSFVALAYLCWLLFALAVYPLPFFVAAAVGLVAYHSGSGPIGAIIVGAIASGVSLGAGRLAFTALRSPIIRAALRSPIIRAALRSPIIRAALRSPIIRAVIALVFAIPAALAGYHAVLGLAHIGAVTNGWQQAIAVMGAIVVVATAWARMTLSTPPNPNKASPPASHRLFP